MSLMALKHRTNYGRLRSAYDLAFRHLAAQLQHLQDLKNQNVADPDIIAQAERQIARAHNCYLEARNALTDLLMARQAENDAATTVVHTVWNDYQFASGARYSWPSP